MAVKPITVTVTGAGGQIAYSLLFRLASGAMLGPNQPVRLQLLEIPEGLRAAEGTALELTDCAFPLLADVNLSSEATAAFDGTEVALLLGSRPRTKGMERADLLEGNGAISAPTAGPSTITPPIPCVSWWSVIRQTPTHSSPASTPRMCRRNASLR